MNIIEDINNLEKNFFQKEIFDSFLQKYSPEIICKELFKTKDKKVQQQIYNLLYQIIRNNQHFQLILFPKSIQDKEQIKFLLCNENSQYRMLISEAINLHAESIAIKLNEMYADIQHQEQNLEESVQIICQILSDQESEVGLKILSALKKIIKKKLLTFTSTKLWIDKMKLGMQHHDEVIRLRFMEIVIELSNNSQETHEALINQDQFFSYLKKGLIELAIQQYQTDDILVKLNAVEIFSQFGSAQWNAQFLSQHSIMQQIIHEAFDAKQEFYVRKYLIILVSKLIGNQVYELNFNLEKKLIIILKELFQSNLQEEIQGALEIISFLVMNQKILNIIVGDKSLLDLFFQFSKSTKQELKKKFLNAFSHIFYAHVGQQKNIKMLANLMICLGNLSLISMMNFQQAPVNLDDMQKSFQYIFDLLYSPFADIEIEALSILKNILPYQVIMKYYIQNQKSIEYLSNYYAKDKEIFDIKNDIKKVLIDFCDNVFQDDMFKQFSENLKKKIVENKSKGKEGDECTYGTEAF